MTTTTAPAGTLYMLPLPLGEGALQTIPPYVISQIQVLDCFLVENAKTARHYLKALQHPTPLPAIQIITLDKHHQSDAPLRETLALLQKGVSVGVLSEAGCAGIADPGAAMVAWAHQHGIGVVPTVGPSSILLALQASGMSGQHFAFQGYLSAKQPAQDLRRLETLALRHRQTQIFIETPYRNNALITTALQTLAPATRFCIAANLTLPTAFVKTLSIKQWQHQPPPDLHKQPTVFLIGA